MELAARQPGLANIVLACQAVNVIDASALESLEAINARLKDSGVALHLAEVKGPVMDRLQHTAFCHEMTGKVFLSTYDAWQELRGAGDGRLSRRCAEMQRGAVPSETFDDAAQPHPRMP